VLFCLPCILRTLHTRLPGRSPVVFRRLLLVAAGDKIRDYQKTSEHASEGNAPGQHEEEEEEEVVVVEQSDAEVQTDDLPRSETCDKQGSTSTAA